MEEVVSWLFEGHMCERERNRLIDQNNFPLTLYLEPFQITNCEEECNTFRVVVRNIVNHCQCIEFYPHYFLHLKTKVCCGDLGFAYFLPAISEDILKVPEISQKYRHILNVDFKGKQALPIWNVRTKQSSYSQCILSSPLSVVTQAFLSDYHCYTHRHLSKHMTLDRIGGKSDLHVWSLVQNRN